mgnify:CR=1
MRTVLFICSILVSLVTIPATAAEPTKQQCDERINHALAAKDGKFTLEVLRSESIKKCFDRFPDLTDKYFPFKINQPRSSRDPAFSVKTNQPGPSRDPAFSVKMQ